MRLLTVCGSLQARSANRALLDVVAEDAIAAGATAVDFEGLRDVPPFDADLVDTPGEPVERWRAAVAATDAVVIAAPEYAGSLAGVVKNALDWLVGSGDLYGRVVGILSAGTTGGERARADLVRTLLWQGAHVVADLGVAAPRTKTDASGAVVDAATLSDLASFTRSVLAAAGEEPDQRLGTVRSVAAAAGVDPARVV